MVRTWQTDTFDLLPLMWDSTKLASKCISRNPQWDRVSVSCSGLSHCCVLSRPHSALISPFLFFYSWSQNKWCTLKFLSRSLLLNLKFRQFIWKNTFHIQHFLTYPLLGFYHIILPRFHLFQLISSHSIYPYRIFLTSMYIYPTVCHMMYYVFYRYYLTQF